ncbi:MAG TPA: hypothetical protein ENK05_07980 [Gammaproteobacteria bacterium]|nr:hypothetical protein [Gammaproteobacteria bacterium]
MLTGRAVLFGLGLLLAACGQQEPASPPATELQLVRPCRLVEGCRATGAPFPLRVFLGPGVTAMRPFPLRLEVGGGVTPETASVDFSMKGMDMGLNRYLLQRQGDEWRARVTLPVCGSGRSDWLADVVIATAQGRYHLQIPFVLGE